MDRDWWHAAKLGITVAVALIAAYTVHLATPLDAIPGAGGIADHALRVSIDRDLHDRAAAKDAERDLERRWHRD